MNLKTTKAQFGGLHLDIKPHGTIIIEIDGKTLLMKYHGQNGENKAAISFLGPKDFAINFTGFKPKKESEDGV